MTTPVNDRLKEYSRAVVVSIIGAPTLTYFSCVSCANDWNKFVLTASISAMMWIVMWVGNSELTHQISRFIPWVEFPMKRLVVGVITTFIFTVGVAILMLKLWEYSRGFKFKSYSDFVVISLIVTFLITFFLHGREFLLRWKQAAVDAERYQRESVAATYESLKSQVNPHFLFNSLNVLTNLVYKDQDKAAAFIKKMSEVYRYVLDTRDREVVDLTEELEFTESYIYLQQIRFGDNLKVRNQINAKQGKVVPLAIQMLIENAIKHNEVSAESPLTIDLIQSEGFITVINNIQRKSSPAEKHSGVGLENIKRRYEFLSNQEVINREVDGKFEVRIPLLQMDNA
jgi:sensor histidine kinase YesM